MKRLVLLAAAVLLWLPAASHAATLSVFTADSCNGSVACEKYSAGSPVAVVSFLGEPGEANRVTVTREGGTVTVRDEAAPVRPKAPCTAVDERTASCPAQSGEGPIPGFAAGLGDGDDRIQIAALLQTRTSLAGGPGADVLVGGPDDDRLDGGEGRDALTGGEGDDTADYSGRTAPVVVNLPQSAGGELGEGDSLVDLELALGGGGDDVLIGGEGPTTLDGGLGDDRLDGRGGNDVITGGQGLDVLTGGAGDDQLEGDPEQGDDVYTAEFTPRRDTLSGGSGDDVLTDQAGGGDRLSGGSGDDRLALMGGGSAVLRGGPGNDELEGGEGRDRFFGDAGRDSIDARDARIERVDCGTGRDRIRSDRRDRLRRCERRR
ncbi:MAG: Alkaline phosphatase [uncultured Solirubrobacteraceae bacterium]|uniref:Alkaline phosphatase n=1 Tax=uncultured Solirubrobacteraceae bacterium TaxID=1162706 RepID=A0A6J4TRF6_9ACTN|nr:MAG: Alkaline phosphatase [uncultured Solirubrobacteraceae bacterium]